MSEDVDADVDMSLKTRNTLDTAAFRRSLSIMMEMGWAGMMRFTDRQFIIHHLTFQKKTHLNWHCNFCNIADLVN